MDEIRALLSDGSVVNGKEQPVLPQPDRYRHRDVDFLAEIDRAGKPVVQPGVPTGGLVLAGGGLFGHAGRIDAFQADHRIAEPRPGLVQVLGLILPERSPHIAGRLIQHADAGVLFPQIQTQRIVFSHQGKPVQRQLRQRLAAVAFHMGEPVGLQRFLIDMANHGRRVITPGGPAGGGAATQAQRSDQQESPPPARTLPLIKPLSHDSPPP